MVDPEKKDSTNFRLRILTQCLEEVEKNQNSHYDVDQFELVYCLEYNINNLKTKPSHASQACLSNLSFLPSLPSVWLSVLGRPALDCAPCIRSLPDLRGLASLQCKEFGQTEQPRRPL